MAASLSITRIDVSLAGEAQAIIDEALRLSAPSDAPNFVHLCGIPGAGKTTYVTAWLQANDLFALVQFDSLMERLSGYQRDKALIGLVEAFAKWELPARVIGYHLLQSLIEARRNVIFDHSALNKSHVQLIDGIKQRGYAVEMHYLQCPLELAKERVKIRELKVQRHTPERLIFERQALLNELLPVYRRIVDRFVCVDGDAWVPMPDYVSSSIVNATDLVSSFDRG